jgi:hypothetical protein
VLRSQLHARQDMQRSVQYESVACNSAALARTYHLQAGIQDFGMLSQTALTLIRRPEASSDSGAPQHRRSHALKDDTDTPIRSIRHVAGLVALQSSMRVGIRLHRVFTVLWLVWVRLQSGGTQSAEPV